MAEKKTRFNKTKLISDLWIKFRACQARHRFDPDNGTAQLRPRSLLAPASASMQELIDRCVAYGRYRALEEIARDVQNNEIGA